MERIKKKKKKWHCRRRDDSHMGELSFATIIESARQLLGRYMLKYHSILTFLPKKKNTKFVSFIYFIFHLGFGFLLSPNSLIKIFVLRDSIS